ncbi:MAG TPA: hypothetical protein VFI96_04280 [Longimicrobiaceae bacterium]|nr:hypothetical protein [Longimicrobiaceae bacterium]
MIASLTMQMRAPIVVRKTREDVALLGELRSEAAREAEALFYGVSGKRINGGLLPGVTRHSVSRAMNGCDSNPLYRLPSWFVLCRRIGIPKARLQRILDWLQRKLDEAYEGAPTPTLEEIHREEQARDAAEDVAQMHAATTGEREALAEWLDRVRERRAFDATVIACVEMELQAQSG